MIDFIIIFSVLIFALIVLRCLLEIKAGKRMIEDDPEDEKEDEWYNWNA